MEKPSPDVAVSAEAAAEFPLEVERLANLGRLLAGLAHEMSNPLAFVVSNLQSLERYREKMMTFVSFVEAQGVQLARSEVPEAAAFNQGLVELRDRLKLPFVLDDFGALIRQTQEGMGRLQGLLQSLRRFARRESEPREVDLNATLETVLTLLGGELKKLITLECTYGSLPPLRCQPGELAQVLLGLFLRLARGITRTARMQVETLPLKVGVRLVVVLEGDGHQAALGALEPAGGAPWLTLDGRPLRLQIEPGEGRTAIALELPPGA